MRTKSDFVDMELNFLRPKGDFLLPKRNDPKAERNLLCTKQNFNPPKGAFLCPKSDFMPVEPCRGVALLFAMPWLFYLPCRGSVICHAVALLFAVAWLCLDAFGVHLVQTHQGIPYA